MKKMISVLALLSTLGSAAKADCIGKYDAEISRLGEKMITRLAYNDGKGRKLGGAIVNTAAATAAGAVVGFVGGGTSMVIASGLVAAAPFTVAGGVITAVTAPRDPDMPYSSPKVDEGVIIGTGVLTLLGATIAQTGWHVGLVSAGSAVWRATPIGAAVSAGVGATTGLVLGTRDSILANKIRKLYDAKQLIQMAKDNKVAFAKDYYKKMGKEVRSKFTVSELLEHIKLANEREELCFNDEVMDFKEIKKMLK